MPSIIDPRDYPKIAGIIGKEINCKVEIYNSYIDNKIIIKYLCKSGIQFSYSIDQRMVDLSSDPYTYLSEACILLTKKMKTARADKGLDPISGIKPATLAPFDYSKEFFEFRREYPEPRSHLDELEIGGQQLKNERKKLVKYGRY